jgi:hypothetical protein
MTPIAKILLLFPCSFCISLPGMVHAQNLYAGLVACYNFTGNASDGSGNNYNGKVNGATLTSDRFGNSNSAYQFNGAGDYISIPPNGMENVNYTWSAWVFIQAFPAPGKSMEIISIGDLSVRTQSIGIRNDPAGSGFGQFLFVTFYGLASATDTSAGFEIAYPPVPPLQGWFHLVAVRGYGSESIYVNGVAWFERNTPLTPDYGYSTQANIGARSNFTQYFNGVIDDVAIYNRAITADEVFMLYQQGLPCSPGVAPVAYSPWICGSGSVSITATGGTTYRWYDAAANGNLLLEGNPFTTPVLSTTTYFYVSKVTGEVESARAPIKVTVFPVPQVACAGPVQAQANVPVSFSASIGSGTPPFNFLFDFGDGTNAPSSHDSLTHQYTRAGLYAVTVTATDSNRCTASCTENIQVIKQVPVPSASNISICGVGSATLNADGGTTYRWYDAAIGGNLLFAGNPFVTPILSSATDFYVCNFLDDFESLRFKVSVIVFPQPQLTCTAPPEVVNGDSFIVSTAADSGSPPFKYAFDFGDGVKTMTSQQTETHQYNQDGLYTIVISLSDSNGCATSCSKETRSIKIFVPNVITANNDTLNDRLTVFESFNNRWKSYTGSISFSLNVIDRWGNQIFQTNNSVDGWNAENVSSGLYFFLITFGRNRYSGWVSVLK